MALLKSNSAAMTLTQIVWREKLIDVQLTRNSFKAKCRSHKNSNKDFCPARP